MQTTGFSGSCRLPADCVKKTKNGKLAKTENYAVSCSNWQ
jgi:hypothetical protein